MTEVYRIYYMNLAWRSVPTLPRAAASAANYAESCRVQPRNWCSSENIEISHSAATQATRLLLDCSRCRMKHNLSSVSMDEELRASLTENDIVAATKLLERHPIQHTPISYIPSDATVLHIASILGFVDVVQVLLEQSTVDANAVDEQGWSALIHSITNGQNEIIRLLLDSKQVDVNLCDVYGQTALHIEAEAVNKNALIAEWLIESGASLDIEDRDGMTPFLRAIEAHNFPVARCLVDKNCNRHARSSDGRSCLHIAAQHHFIDMVLWMIGDLKINANVLDNNFQTPAMLCVQRCSPGPSVLKLMHHLLKAGTKVNLQDCNRNTLLLLALSNPTTIKHKHVRLLLEHGADPNLSA